MASSLLSNSAPQCIICLRRYASYGYGGGVMQITGLRQQIRGKRKMANNSAMVTVRLMKDVEAYGRKGTVVPLPRGEMRNVWFPRGTAEYVTTHELKKLRLSNSAFTVERDFQFTLKRSKRQLETPEEDQLSVDEITSASAFQKKADLENISPERSIELLEYFVGPRLEFYRQPVIEEKELEEEQQIPEQPEKRSQYGSGAAADLLAARMQNKASRAVASAQAKAAEGKIQAIYGSVTSLDVLQAVRAALAEDDEAKRVVLTEQGVQFVDLPATEGETGRAAKHVGDFMVDIRARGTDTPVRRVVRVIPQELER